MRGMMRQRAGRALGVLVTAGLLMGAGPVRIEAPITGQVTDVDTQAPIEGAVLRLEQVAWCSTLHGASRHPKTPREALTAADGRFTVGGGLAVAPCPWAWWSTDLHVLAPGYLTDGARDTDLYTTTQPSVRPGSFELDRIRYRVELQEYERLAKDPRGEAGSRWAEALAAARRLPVRPIGRPGVFVSQPGAVFDRVATVQRGHRRRLLDWGVVAQDRTTGALSEWTIKGTAEAIPAIPAGATLLPGRRSNLGSEPFFAQPEAFSMRLVVPRGSTTAPPTWVAVPAQFGGLRGAGQVGVWLLTVEANGREIAAYDLDRWFGSILRPPGEPREIRPGPRLALAEFLPGAAPPIECMAPVSGARSGLAFIARAGEARALYLFHGGPERDPQRWKAERIDVVNGVLASEATACAGGRDALYVALKDGEILKLDIGQYHTGRGMDWRYGGKVTARVALAGPAGPLTFTALAVADLDRMVEVLYAAAGDDAIYRFSADLRPDQRIELGATSGSGPRSDR